jgi:hypothetical protein
LADWLARCLADWLARWLADWLAGRLGRQGRRQQQADQQARP